MKNQLSNQSMKVSLNKRFEDLWQRCLVPNSNADSELVYLDLLQRYSKPDLNYHNMSHLIQCLEELDMALHLIPHPDAVEMALWYHDAVYIPGRTDNEQKSAELFLNDATACFSNDFKSKVEKLILATTHRDAPRNDDECFIVDIDLSSFGSDWGDFLADSLNLREERIDLSDSAYFEAHTRFLKLLLARKRIFYTDFFYLRYEQTAVQNITCLLAKRKA
ncbi:MAG: HD domain-containing protein, partial [Methylococcaceae bacterium]